MYVHTHTHTQGDSAPKERWKKGDERSLSFKTGIICVCVSLSLARARALSPSLRVCVCVSVSVGVCVYTYSVSVWIYTGVKLEEPRYLARGYQFYRGNSVRDTKS